MKSEVLRKVLGELLGELFGELLGKLLARLLGNFGLRIPEPEMTDPWCRVAAALPEWCSSNTLEGIDFG